MLVTDLEKATALAKELTRIKSARQIVEDSPTLLTIGFSKGVIGDGEPAPPQLYMKPGEPEFDQMTALVRATMARDIMAIEDELRQMGMIVNA